MDGLDQLVSKFHRLLELIRQADSVLVAFSGGVDSTFLLKAARDALGNGVLAVTIYSETTDPVDLEDAHRLGRELGVEHLILPYQDLQTPGFADNPEHRCYLCKRKRYAELLLLAAQHHCEAVLDGQNADDMFDYRPGSEAAVELGIRRPLHEVGFSKDEIRRMSKALGLSTWNKPPGSCLASRIPFGQPITTTKLNRVMKAESYLRSLVGRGTLRVRHPERRACIEADPEIIPLLCDPRHRENVVSRLKSLGFDYVTVDLEGYRTGSLNPRQDRSS